MSHGGTSKRSRPWVAAGLMLALLATGACRDAASASGTALYVTTEFDPLLELTQFRVSGDVEGGGISSSVLPSTPDRILQSGETFRVLLPDAAEGTQATLRVEGLHGGAVVALGEGSARVRKGSEVEVSVRLSATVPPDGQEPDGGTDGGRPDAGTGTDAGTRTDAGTFCVDCASGCCQSGICTSRTFLTCGIGGVACTGCDPGRADTCSPQGFCACGTSPACGGLNVDRCAGGQCKCGSGGACGAGQACVQGRCQCTPESCGGCCAGDTCRPGTDKKECGRSGGSCRKCNNSCLPDGSCQ